MKALVIGLVLVVLAAAGAVFYFNNQAPATPLPTVNTSAPNQSEDMMVIDDKVTIDSAQSVGSDDVKVESYREYSKDSFEVNAGKKTRMLFFYADWCPTCRPVDADIKANLDKIPKDVEIIRVNYNDTSTDSDEEKLAAKYGITYQHTFVQIDSAGNEVTKWNGGDFDKLVMYMRSINALDEPGHGLKQPF